MNIFQRVKCLFGKHKYKTVIQNNKYFFTCEYCNFKRQYTERELRLFNLISEIIDTALGICLTDDGGSKYINVKDFDVWKE